MGAYYTKEDITEYIAKNCVIPFLLDAAGDKLCDASWNLLAKIPTATFIQLSVTESFGPPRANKACRALPLPDYIEQGVDTSKPELRKRRARWNEPATPS